LTVRQVIHAPVPANDNYSTGEDVPLVVGAEMGVLANDVNLDAGALAAEVVTGPAHGTLTLNTDGSFTFTPEANWHGSDSFTYKAINNGLETISSANIVVEPLNDHPVAVNDAFTISPGGPAPASVQANDSDIDSTTLTTSLVSGPAHGSLSLNSDGTFTYTPAEGYVGDDTFRYQLHDGMANSNVATVTLQVEAGPDEAPLPELENQRPIAVNDTFSVESGLTLNALPISGVLFNDTDPEGSPLSASLFSGPLHGALTLAADGSFSYTPTSGYEGMDAFLYRVTDGELWSAFAAVTIHVTPAQAPDEAPLPELEPEPAPTPAPCQVVCDDAPEEVPEATPDDEGSCFEDAVDALFSRGRWYA
jgi:VCBS repeat-containing protein